MAISPTAHAVPRAIETARSRLPGTLRTTGRATPIRSTNRPIAAITDRTASDLAAISRGVAAVSEIDGMLNCGAGPGFGPTANVNAPRTGCPSTEITRQYTRYHPWASRLSGTTRVVGSVAERRGGPARCWLPAASVTETTAN